MSRPFRGFALIYVMPVIVMLAIFFTLVFQRVLQSLRFNVLDENALAARQLARMATELGYTLFQTQGPHWYESSSLPRPASNSDFGPQFSSQAIGGNFTLQVLDRSEISPDPFPPDSATYVVAVGIAQVGKRQARSTMSLKLTNPCINFLSVTPTFLSNSGGSVNGPIYAVSDPPVQPTGVAKFAHQGQHPRGPFNSIFAHYFPVFGGEIQSTGDIILRNDDFRNGPQLPPMQLQGSYPAGTTLQYLDLTPYLNVTPQGGTLVFTRNSTLKPNVEYSLNLPTMQQLMNFYATHLDSSVQTIPITSADYPQGALLEFHDGKATLSSVEQKPIGRCFDRSIKLNSSGVGGSYPLGHDYLVAFAVRFSGSPSLSVLSELLWDDPTYPNAPAPAFLSGSFTDGIGGSFSLPAGDADYTPFCRVVRNGPPKGSWNLSRSNWTILRLVAQDGNVAAAKGDICPPLYVRGIVYGKVVVVYEAANESISPYTITDVTKTKVHTFILGDHEDPDDNPGLQITSAPGVPGSLTLSDPNVKVAPGPGGTYSEDYALVLSRDTVNFRRSIGGPFNWLVDNAGLRLDYRQKLLQLDSLYQTKYGARYNFDTANFQCWAAPPCDTMTISRFSNQFVSAPNGQIYPFDSGVFEFFSKVSPAGPWPAGKVGADSTTVPTYWRLLLDVALRCHGKLQGGMTSLEGSGGTGDGWELQYDYRWRSKNEAELLQDIKLPIGPIPLDRRETTQ